MRIIIDITTLLQEQRTGVQRVTWELTKALMEVNKGKHDIKCLMVLPRQVIIDKEIEKYFALDRNKLRTIRVPAKVFHWGMKYWQKYGGIKLDQIIGEMDIYHSFDWFHLPTRAMSTSFIFDMTVKTHPEWQAKDNRKIQEARLVIIKNKCSFIFVDSKSAKRDVIRNLGIDKDKLEVIYPGCGTSYCRLGGDDKKVINKYHLSKRYLLFVGTLEKRKNIPRLIEAYKKLERGKKEKVDLVLVGKMGNIGQEVKRCLEKTVGIKRLGFINESDLPVIYRKSCGLIYPSLYEGFGMPVLEAMNCGCPVVTSKTSSMPEVVGRMVKKVDPDSIEEIATGMNWLIELKGRKKREMINYGIKRAQGFSYRKAAVKIIQKWEQIKNG